MRISGIEPSSVILSQRKYLKRLKDNVPNSLTSCDFEYITILKYIDFFTLYTTIPHRKLKKKKKQTFSLSFETPFFSKVEMGDTNTGILL